jgi:branched-chain amino acid transport system ATP-binding protein
VVKNLGIGILLVEQNAKQSLAIADRGYLLENTRITHEDTATRLATDPAVQKAYLGVSSENSNINLADDAKGQKDLYSETVPVELRPQPRRSANQQIGLDIEDLVESASVTSAGSVSAGKPILVAQKDLERTVAPRLEVVLKEIELAAKNARANSTMQKEISEKKVNLTSVVSASNTPADVKPPVIEIYRRPRVQVFRRYDGDFERD